MSQSVTTESVEEFLARGGVIQQIEQGVSGDRSLMGFNNIPLSERIAMQKRRTYRANKKLAK